ncbi:hypothetical protein C7B61_22175 [filamentous cyanobacterium CCP1]|nr:hypothetical protein C7B76_05925 [filamentous cyanobacterium CCP2]PSB54555.1 hypothetical protein C7B61_22175 [filamentous cyanobacterium CCP1]
MRHPFDLNLDEIEAIDLEFLEELSEAESSQVDGSFRSTTKALGEEGGGFPVPAPKPYPSPRSHPRPHPIAPPEVTTLALGEEGGEWATTLALGEEGGDVVTTMAIGEEGRFQIQ